MNALRTLDSRFASLPGFRFAPHYLDQTIRGCPEPMEVSEGGHFVQEWGAPVAAAAPARFGLSP